MASAEEDPCPEFSTVEVAFGILFVETKNQVWTMFVQKKTEYFLVAYAHVSYKIPLRCLFFPSRSQIWRMENRKRLPASATT